MPLRTSSTDAYLEAILGQVVRHHDMTSPDQLFDLERVKTTIRRLCSSISGQAIRVLSNVEKRDDFADFRGTVEAIQRQTGENHRSIIAAQLLANIYFTMAADRCFRLGSWDRFSGRQREGALALTQLGTVVIMHPAQDQSGVRALDYLMVPVRLNQARQLRVKAHYDKTLVTDMRVFGKGSFKDISDGNNREVVIESIDSIGIVRVQTMPTPRLAPQGVAQAVEAAGRQGAITQPGKMRGGARPRRATKTWPGGRR